MDLFGPIIEILKFLGPPLYKCIEYHRKLEEYKENLKRILEELNSKKDEIELRLKAECGFGKVPKIEVKNWLEGTQKIIDEAKTVEQTFSKGKCFSRARLAKLVENKIQQVQKYCEKGNSFDNLVIDAPPSIGLTFPTTTLVGETTAKKNMEEIWRHLMDNEIKKIGIFGMGEVGKTTIVTHLNNRLIEEKRFDLVIWVTVSQTLNLIKVQNGIANALKQSLPSIEDVKIRAGMLLSMLEGKRFVIILDDMWETMQLDEVGIPEPIEENGCKLVITTRSSDVCRSMGCKTVEVKPLSENEALELFFQKAQLDISKVPTLKETVELVVKQCAGLPLAIVTIASSLKGENDIHEWRNALNELSNNLKSIKVDDEKIFVRLKFSYDRLKNERIQHCFLYCALYPEDFDIPKKELIDCWIEEGLIEEIDDLQATEDRAEIIIKNLINNCLLLESTDDEDESCVKLHDVVRDMALKYITRKRPLFMVKAGLKLEKLPGDQEWNENLVKVSLMKNDISEIPSSMSPNCKTLSTLLLQENPLKSIPESFFLQMHGLKILNLSGTQIESLPNSVSELTNLTALLLNDCDRLKRVPSLAKLRALRKLDLGFTAINEVPAGMEMLTNLTSLDLFSAELSKLPAGMFSKLCRLQKLWVYWGLETLGVAKKEATKLKNLDHLVAQFCNLRDFNCYAKSINSHEGPKEYCLLLNSEEPDLPTLVDWKLEYGTNKAVIVEGCDICGGEEDSIFLPRDVESLSILMCNDVRNISDISTFNTLERLEILRVDNLLNLTELLNVSESSSPAPYSHLKSIHIDGCHKLNKLFTSKQLSELENLEWIDVESCDEMEELIAVDDYENEERGQKEFLLPKLKELSLVTMPKLKSICNGVMVCDSLQEVEIWDCPQLKRLPLYLPVDEKGQPSPPPALIEIAVFKDWWEALEWDHLHPDAKTLLLPFCQFRE